MIYVPILKNRKQELKVVRDLRDCFSENMIPLFEIINDEYQVQYLTNPETGEIVYETKQGNKRKTKVKLAPTKEDIVTLYNIQERVANKMAFIDYFRFKKEEYPKINIDLEKVELSILLSRNFDEYKERILKVSQYENLIPVISVKKQFPITERELENFIGQLQTINSAIAFRLTADIIDDYKDIIQHKLRQEDYFMIDIREQSVDSRFMELTEIEDLQSNAKIILLNSPRKLSIKNNQYEEYGLNKLIDNSALKEYKDYHFNGVGDYGGLKDSLPASKAGGSGKGCALALLYMHSDNKFFSLMNKNTNLGQRGYIGIKARILKEKEKFNPDGDCPAFNKIKMMDGAGGWSTWSYITFIRYIHQIYKSL